MQCGMGVPFMAVKFHILVFWVWYGRLLNGHPSISNEPLLCTYLYDSWYENASLSSSSLYIYIYIYIYGAGWSFLPYPLDIDAVQLH